MATEQEYITYVKAVDAAASAFNGAVINGGDFATEYGIYRDAVMAARAVIDPGVGELPAFPA
jgi:hypothetical protein